jgi:predicted glutamine amidotransferase
MCLALYKPAKIKLSRKEMRTAFKNNPDGAGFAFYDPTERKVVICKGYFYFEDLWDAYITATDNQMLAAMMHFRWTTHGATNYDNCHPFYLQDGALIHNGIIELDEVSVYGKWTSGKYMDDDDGDRSDTRVFCEDYINEMDREMLQRSRKLIEHVIGWSKLVTMHDDGSVLIFNESKGHWRKGCWYSNDSYKPHKHNYGTSTTTTSYPKSTTGTSNIKVTGTGVMGYIGTDGEQNAGTKLYSGPLANLIDDEESEWGGEGYTLPEDDGRPLDFGFESEHNKPVEFFRD